MEFTPLNKLHEGAECQIEVMVAKKWDVKTKMGKYIATEYLLSDSKGNIMQCTACTDLTHSLVSSLDEGLIYQISGFTLVKNKEKYRIRRDNDYVILLQADSIISHVESEERGFVRHAYDITELEDVTYVGSRYLIDIIGCVTNIGSPRRIQGHDYIECMLINERGTQMRITVWGNLSTEMLAKRPANGLQFNVLLTAMNVNKFREEISLSTTLDTTINDARQIPHVLLFTYKLNLSRKHLLNSDIHVVGGAASKRSKKEPAGAAMISLTDLIQFAESRNKGGTFRCRVVISRVPLSNVWYHCLCTENKCMRELLRIENSFWCETCEIFVEQPDVRLKIELQVHDGTSCATITTYDEIVEKLNKKKAADLLTEHIEDGVSSDMIPMTLRELTGTSQLIEVKTATYRSMLGYPNFVCNDVLALPSTELDF